MRVRVIPILMALAAAPALVVGSPIIGGGTWASWPVVNNDNVPFWDRVSSDGAACNVGYFLAGSFGPCSNLKNGTPASGLEIGGENLEFYSNNNAITGFYLAPGEWTFTLEGRIAGSSTFQVGYYYPFGPTPVLIPLFNESDWKGDTVTVASSQPIALYLMDGPYFFRSYGSDLGVAAFHNTQMPLTFYFGFEDRPQGDWDMNDVVLSAHYVPEPSTYVMIGAGLAALGLMRRWRA